jgi:hypothetical protein
MRYGQNSSLACIWRGKEMGERVWEVMKEEMKGEEGGGGEFWRSDNEWRPKPDRYCGLLSILYLPSAFQYDMPETYAKYLGFFSKFP